MAANSAAKSTGSMAGTPWTAGWLMAPDLPGEAAGTTVRPSGPQRLGSRWPQDGTARTRRGPEQGDHQPGEGYGMRERVVVRPGQPDDPGGRRAHRAARQG